MPSVALPALGTSRAVRRIQRRRRFSCSILVFPVFSLLPLAFSLLLCVNRISPSSLPLLLLKLVLAYPSVMPSGSPVNLVQSPFFLYASFPVLLPDVV